LSDAFRAAQHPCSDTRVQISLGTHLLVLTRSFKVLAGMSYSSSDHEVNRTSDAGSQSVQLPPDEVVDHTGLEDQLWRYRSQFKTLLGACLDLLGSRQWSSSGDNKFRRCHHRLKLWTTGIYSQLVDDDTCEWNHGARALMNSIAVYTIDIAILLSKSTVFSLGTKLSATDMIKTVRGSASKSRTFSSQLLRTKLQSC
jgi:hypothetical protein